MGLFAAGNEIVTIIIALIPVAVFLLSSLFKASQKPAKPLTPPQGPKPGNQGVPGTMDLDSFLKEAKRRKAQQQNSAGVKPPPPPKPLVMPGQTPRPGQKPPPIPTLSQPKVSNRGLNPPQKPLRPEKTREPEVRRETQLESARKSQREEITPPVRQVAEIMAPAEVALSENRGPNRKVAPTRVTTYSGQSPVSLALQLVRSGKAAPTSFVLQEIFGRPRSQRPFQPPSGGLF